MLNQPLWPASRFNLTTPLSLALTLACVAIGVPLYLQGYTYEGAAFFYMFSAIAFAYPYYNASYTGYMTVLVMAAFIPVSIWAQNKAVETGSWYYRPRSEYLIWITKDGEGWWHWTRHLWLGNDMPAMEYAFYPMFCLFQITLHSLFSYLVPDRWFEQAQRKLRWVFPVVMIPIIGAFVAIYFRYPKPGVTDYLYWLAAFGFAITVVAYFISPNYRKCTQSPAFWIWGVGMAAGFMPAWEFFHCCLNRDWIYDPQKTFPFFITYHGHGIPISELLGYATTATTFQALMLLYIKRFGKIVIRNYALVPFSRYHG